MKPSMAMTYKNLIGGRWVESSTGMTFTSVNPADTSDEVGYFQQSTAEETGAAINAAKDAQRAWGAASPAKRAEVLYKAAQLIEGDTSELARLLTREEGKTLAESTAEVKRSAANFRFYAGQAYLVGGETLPSDESAVFLYTLK